jgi:Arc/MetJ-type ribon-helix-helix transcriptional regulator
MLTRVFYISEITELVTDIDIQVILGAAQVNNRRLDVTGMLAQSDGHFAQLLEGRSDVMRALLAKIEADRRHKSVRLLLQDSIQTRQFARWAMGLVRRDDMAEEMKTMHRAGCENNAEARRLIQQLMANSA